MDGLNFFLRYFTINVSEDNIREARVPSLISTDQNSLNRSGHSVESESNHTLCVSGHIYFESQLLQYFLLRVQGPLLQAAGQEEWARRTPGPSPDPLDPTLS